MEEDRLKRFGKPTDFTADWQRDGYHCEECATHAGYGIFHYDTLAEQRRKHQEKYGWGEHGQRD